MYARWSSLVTVPETRTAAISTLCRFHVHTAPETKYTALRSGTKWSAFREVSSATAEMAGQMASLFTQCHQRVHFFWDHPRISTHFLNIITPMQISYNLFLLFLLLYDLKSCGFLTFELPFEFPAFTTFQNCYRRQIMYFSYWLDGQLVARTSSVCRSTDYTCTLIHLCSSFPANDTHITGINLW